MYILLPRYGITGYFVSFLVTHAVNFFLSIRRLLLITKITIPVRIPAMTLAAAAAAVYAAGYVPSPLLRSAAFITILTCLLFLLKVLSREDIAWVKGLIYKK